MSKTVAILLVISLLLVAAFSISTIIAREKPFEPTITRFTSTDREYIDTAPTPTSPNIDNTYEGIFSSNTK